MIRLEPAWLGELLAHYVRSDWDDARGELGYPQVSPMFRKAVGSSFELEDVTGYSSAEMRAMAHAIDWLQAQHAEHWRALSREFRTWTRSTLPAKPGDEQLVLEAGILLAKKIDDLLD